MVFKHLCYLLISIISLTLVACVSSPKTSSPPNTQEPIETVTQQPAAYELISLSVVPQVAKVGEMVQISSDVKNIGGAEGIYTAVLKMDGIEQQTEMVDLPAGTTKTVTFSIVQSKAGARSIELGNLTGTLSVESFSPQAFTNPQIYKVSRTLTVKNETAEVKVVRLWMPAVVDWDSQRNVITEKSNTMRKGIWRDTHSGTVISFWDFYGKPSGGSSLVVEEQFYFTCYEVNYSIDPNKVTEYENNDPQYLLYTRPEKYLEADDPNIMKTAVALRRNRMNPYSIADSIYEWVIDHMQYQDIEGLSGAQFAFENGYGNCADYSALFVALCRATGIPSRPIVGRLASSVEGDWHVWAEFYVPGYGWVPVDPTMQDLWGLDYFGHIDNKRLIFNKQFNIVLHPTPNYIPSQQSLFQSRNWEYQGDVGEIDATIEYSGKPVSRY